jgi:hypothetical protein
LSIPFRWFAYTEAALCAAITLIAWPFASYAWTWLFVIALAGGAAYVGMVVAWLAARDRLEHAGFRW